MAASSFRTRLFKLKAPLFRATTGVALGCGGVFVATRFFDLHWVSGPSMSPALSPDFDETGQQDYVLARKFWGSDLHRGDVIVFWKPHDPEALGVKRVLALPGDKVQRDPRRLENDRNSRRFGFVGVDEQVVVPQGHVWVEGDNWRKSLDSNDFSTIPINLVTARVTRIIWPPNRFGPLPSTPNVSGSKTRVTPGVVPEMDWEIFNYD
jgi:inner membrane protease subunit 2